jgi:hypothetical protein
LSIFANPWETVLVSDFYPVYVLVFRFLLQMYFKLLISSRGNQQITLQLTNEDVELEMVREREDALRKLEVRVAFLG